MKTTSKILFAAAVALAGATSAQAMPVAQSDEVAAAAVETVGWRCGPGWHANPWGRCVPNRPWRRHWRHW